MAKKIDKRIFGIHKSHIDDNTVIYSSFDGSVTSEVGVSPTLTGTASYKPMPTGLGLQLDNAEYLTYVVTGLNACTADIIVETASFFRASTNANHLYALTNNDESINFGISKTSSSNSLRVYYGSTYSVFVVAIPNTPYTHIRFTVNNTDIKVYINGVLVTYKVIDRALTSATTLYVGRIINWGYVGTISDLSISNIDRGDYFPTLPKDFIAGYAKLAPAFSNQRGCYADPLTSEVKTDLVKIGYPNAPQLTVSRTSGNWASGDTIKVKGLGGEIISGVVDSDTALARILSVVSGISNGGTTGVLQLDDVSKIAVNDIFKILLTTTNVHALNYTVNSVDTTLNQITITASGGSFSTSTSSDIILGAIIETTTSTSSPNVKYMNGTTLTAVTGTWSNLGTNEATFTLGTNASLTTQDLQIEYSLNEVAGQGQTEVLSTTLGGEVNGKKLVVGTVAVRDDFKGKVANSIVENPHRIFYKTSTVLETPSGSWNEYVLQSEMDVFSTLNGVSKSVTTSTNGHYAQKRFSFNLIRLIEDKFGKIPSVDPVGWLKANINKITCNAYVYGACPSGNKANIAIFATDTNTWSLSSNHLANIITVLTSTSTVLSNKIDANGFTHFLAYTDPSDGVTASTIYCDYVSIEVELKGLTGYDMLVPENPRRDESWKITSADMKKVDDFSNKSSGSNLLNPHSFYRAYHTALRTPSEKHASDSSLGFLEFATTASYDTIKYLDGTIQNGSANSNGAIPQHLFSWNIIELIERKYGTIPATDKVAFAKLFVDKVVCNWWGYGSCPSGNKAYLKVFNNNAWDSDGFNNTSSSPSVITRAIVGYIQTGIQSDGYMHFLAHTDASDGTTPSVINTDYCSIEVTLKDTAIPYLDYFKGKYSKNNVLLVRKETKEVRTYFGADKNDSISVIGEYVPYAGLGDKITKAKILAVGDPIITTLGTGGSDGNIDYTGLRSLSSRLPSLIDDYKLTCERFKTDGLNVVIDTVKLKNNGEVYGSNGSSTERRLYPVEGVYLSPYSTLAITPIRGINKRPSLFTDNISNSSAQIILQLSLPQTLPNDAIISIPLLITENSNLYLAVLSTKKSSTLTSGSLIFYSNQITYDVFPVSGKPLIK